MMILLLVGLIGPLSLAENPWTAAARLSAKTGGGLDGVCKGVDLNSKDPATENRYILEFAKFRLSHHNCATNFVQELQKNPTKKAEFLKTLTHKLADVEGCRIDHMEAYDSHVRRNRNSALSGDYTAEDVRDSLKKAELCFQSNLSDIPFFGTPEMQKLIRNYQSAFSQELLGQPEKPLQLRAEDEERPLHPGIPKVDYSDRARGTPIFETAAKKAAAIAERDFDGMLNGVLKGEEANRKLMSRAVATNDASKLDRNTREIIFQDDNALTEFRKNLPSSLNTGAGDQAYCALLASYEAGAKKRDSVIAQLMGATVLASGALSLGRTASGSLLATGGRFAAARNLLGTPLFSTTARLASYSAQGLLAQRTIEECLSKNPGTMTGNGNANNQCAEYSPAHFDTQNCLLNAAMTAVATSPVVLRRLRNKNQTTLATEESAAAR